ncbi:MAG: DUF4230 domain-containing protein [Ruminococcus sp.]|nr:DUF4230 domain-containing protein [Ruminococcus sp.]
MRNKNNNEISPNRKKYEKPVKNTIIAALSIALIIPLSTILFTYANDVKAQAMSEQYETAFQKSHDEAYEKFYESAYNKAEEKYHVKNEVSIIVDSIKQEEKLEVLKVSDVEFVIRDANKENGNVVSWLEVTGNGVFTVNLKASEFIVDNERNYVLVRVPKPVVNCAVDYKNIALLKFENKNWIRNGNYSDGTDKAQEDIEKGFRLIKEELNSNQNFNKSAEESARTIIENLVLALNSEVVGLKVEVEFY